MCLFGQLIIRKIIKTVAIRSHTLKLQCTKFYSAQDLDLDLLTLLQGELAPCSAPPDR